MTVRTSEAPLLSALFDTTFTEITTPKLMKWLYIVFLIVVGFTLLWAIPASFAAGPFLGLIALLLTLLLALLSVLLVRVYLELIAMAFRVASNTAEIADHAAEIAMNTSQRSTPAAVPH